MTARDPKEAADDARKSYDEAIKAMRERQIRAGRILPRQDDPEEMRWFREGKSR